jgi:hypothetical protein
MHVRVCVECGEEYRPEIVACADCGGRLEDRHDDGDRTFLPATEPADSGPEREAEFTETLRRANRVTDLTEEADRLVEAGIAVRLRRVEGEGYWLLVTAHDLDRALAVLGLLADESVPDAGDVRFCPACRVPTQPGTAECPECGLAVGDEPEQFTCARCGQPLDGPECPDCGR